MDESTNRSCPHCGAEVPALAECVRCGIVFAKYRPRPRPAGTVEVGASRPANRPLAPWLALLGLVIVVAVVYSRRDDRAQPAAVPPPAAAPQPVPVTAPEPSSAADLWVQDDDLGPEAEPDPSGTADLWSEDDDFGYEVEAEPEPLAAPPADLEASVSVGYGWFENASGFRSGVELASARSKPIAVYFYTDWCGYCRQFERELLTRARVEDFTKYLVKVRINPESGPREREIARQYGVRGYPSFFVQASAAAAPRKIRQHKRVGGDWVLQSPSDFVTTLKRAIG